MTTPARSAASTVRAVLVVAVLLVGVLAALTVGARPLVPGDGAGERRTPPLSAQPTPTPSAAPTPSTSPTPSPSPTPEPALAGLHVVLDPGHNAGNADAPEQINAPVEDGRGGMKACNTVGTSTASGYPEHAFAWAVAERTGDLLEAQGAQVTLTRGAEGVGPCVAERGRTPGEVDADLLVSIHANGSEDPAVRGYFAMVAEPPLNEAQGEPSRALAENMLRALNAAGFPPSSVFGEDVVGRADLATLNHSERPAVMLELAEMRNPEEASLAESEAGQERYARAVAAGVTAWADTRP